MLVQLVISGKDNVGDLDLFISVEPMPKQTQVPTWKVTAMIYLPVQKPESAVHIKSIDVAATNRLADFALYRDKDDNGTCVPDCSLIE